MDLEVMLDKVDKASHTLDEASAILRCLQGDSVPLAGADNNLGTVEDLLRDAMGIIEEVLP